MKPINIKESSNIKGASYNAMAQVLDITFKNGRTYEYFDVPQSLVDEFIAADSSGKFFFARIKSNYTGREK